MLGKQIFNSLGYADSDKEFAIAFFALRSANFSFQFPPFALQFFYLAHPTGPGLMQVNFRL